jgi:hypothetical protein
MASLQRATLALSALAAFAALSTPAQAVPLTGFGFPNTNPALAGGTVVDFDAATPGLFASVTFGNVTFTGVGSPLNVGPDFNGSFNTRGGQSLFTDFDLDPDAIEITFATPVSAFAFNWGASDNLWLMSAYDSSNTLIESFVIPAVFSSNALEYFGFAASGIARVTLVDQLNNFTAGDYVFIDSFTYTAQTGAVPEPGAVALLGLGLVGLRVVSRRSRT